MLGYKKIRFDGLQQLDPHRSEHALVGGTHFTLMKGIQLVVAVQRCCGL